MGYIKEDEINGNKITISKKVLHLDKYDMYYVNFPMKNGSTRVVRVFCEKGTFPDLESKEFKRLQQNYGRELANFFIKRLIGSNGLIAKEGRDDYIYLGGDFLKNGYIASRNMIQSNGKTGQQNFDNNLFKIQMQVETKENTPTTPEQSDTGGKSYVVGDIHGMYGSYADIMKKLKNNDHLYILGDVIDRGTGGIQILQDIMKRKQNPQNNPEITFLLGNHEMQFLETVAIMIRRGLHKEDLITIMRRKRNQSEMGYYSLFEDNKYKQQYERYKQEFEKYDKIYQDLVKEKGLIGWETKTIELWLNSNRGNTTIFDFLIGGRVKDVKEQNDIYRFLCDSYVALPQNINGKDYLFVHAMPPKDPNMIRNMKQSHESYKFTDLTREQYEFMLQERDDSTYEQAKKFGFTTICGHTPEIGKILKNTEKGFIRIDAGCGHKQRNSKLALYCIDNDSVEYFDEKETTQAPQEL